MYNILKWLLKEDYLSHLQNLLGIFKIYLFLCFKIILKKYIFYFFKLFFYIFKSF